MKLKLEIHEGTTILCVSEDIQPQHAAILKAGIMKLFQSGKKSILLDLTGVTKAEMAVLANIAALREQAGEMNAQMIIASPIEGIGQATNRDQALKDMGSLLFSLLAQEAKIKAQIAKTEKLKTEVSEKLSTLQSNDSELKSLKKENTRIKGMIQALDSLARELWKKRGEWQRSGFPQEKIETLHKAMATALEQDGILVKS